MKLEAEVYRSSRKAGAYLYVAKGKKLDELPEALLKQFGRAEFAMALTLTPEKKLALASAEKVIKSIKDNAYYLQIPPSAEAYMQSIPNDKLFVTEPRT